MAAYVQWLAPQIETLKASIPERLRDLRAEARAQPVHHDRTPDIAASLAAGWETFLRFAREIRVVDVDQQALLWQRGWEALLQAADMQVGYQIDEEPASRFLALLGSAIASGRMVPSGRNRPRPARLPCPRIRRSASR